MNHSTNIVARSTRGALVLLLALALPLAGCASGRAAAPAANVDVAARTDPRAAHVLAFADTSSVRVDVTVPDAGGLRQGVVMAEITDAADGSRLWYGRLASLEVDSAGRGTATGRITGLRPKLWSPQSPGLYRMQVRIDGVAASAEGRARFGFRSVEARDGRILLNGRPVFLRGNAINPPERNVPDSLEENRRFVEPYVRYLKSVGVNIIRLTRHSQVWFDVCDELGMMLFQGNYGTPKGGTARSAPKIPFEESVAWYKEEVLGPLVNHPSVVVYVLTNEQADVEIPYLSTGAAEIDAFLKRAYAALRPWDPNRVYIANAGYGFGRAGDVCDLHRYWGWYYNSVLSFYTMRDPKVCWRTDRAQPMTMTENTGNYTGIDGRFNIVSNTKQPDSQLNWTGHAPNAEQSGRALAYQAWVAKHAIEIIRRIREQNPNVAGISPFTIAFHNWYGITRFEDMKPKPVLAQYRTSFQPVLLSWELWTPQVYTGTVVRPVAHLVNDSEPGEDLSGVILRYTLLGTAGDTAARGRVPMPDAPYYSAVSAPLEVHLDGVTPGQYELHGALLRGSDTLSTNTTPLFVAARDHAGSVDRLPRRVAVYDPDGATVRALVALAVPHRVVRDLAALSPSRDALVIGEGAWRGNSTGAARLRAFIDAGGRVLYFGHPEKGVDHSWLPVKIRFQHNQLDHSLVFPGDRPFTFGMAVNPERPSHPALAGIDRDRLFLWSDYTGWNETRPGFPMVYPVTGGFALEHDTDLGKTAIIADYDHGLQGLALAELFSGRGSVVVSGLGIVKRATRDPVADRMLVNLLRYVATPTGHDLHPLVTGRIVWGDYATEPGVAGIYSGLIVHTMPIVPAELRTVYPLNVDRKGFAYAGGTSGWNTKLAVQYEPRGRRAFGPYHFTTGGSVQLSDSAGSDGTGRLWIRVPPGRATMQTTLINPVAEPLSMEITLNGRPQRVTLAASDTTTVETPTRGETTLAIVFRGDRRIVLSATEFR